MRKFIRIIFLLLLVQYVFGDCSLVEDKCTGDASENHVCEN